MRETGSMEGEWKGGEGKRGGLREPGEKKGIQDRSNRRKRKDSLPPKRLGGGQRPTSGKGGMEEGKAKTEGNGDEATGP